MKKAFWDLLENELSCDPPKTNILIKRIKELKNLMLLCVPSRYDIHLEIEDSLDNDFIIHKIKVGLFNYQELEKYIYYIFDKLKKFQARSGDENTDSFEKNIKTMINNKIKIPKILRDFLEFSFIKFENIYIQKQKFKV